MIMNTKRCPFCDKEFFSPTIHDLYMQEELRLLVIEHYHISEEKYYEITNAPELKNSLNTICNDMKDAIRKFAERFETLQRNETIDFPLENILKQCR